MQTSLDYGEKKRAARLRKLISKTVVYALLAVWALIVLFTF